MNARVGQEVDLREAGAEISASVLTGASETLFPKAEVEGCIAARFEKVAACYRQRTAIKSWDLTISYERLNWLTNRLARAIREKSQVEGEPVAFLLGNGTLPIVAIFGVLKVGGFYLPLDPAFPIARLAYMLEDSGARLLITNDANLALAEELAGDRLPLVNLDRLDERLSERDLCLRISPDALACLHYTSGSTGQPKGVVQNHRNLLHAAWSTSQNYQLHLDDRVALLHSTGFAASILPIFGTLLTGATLYPFDLKNELAHLGSWLEHEQITVFMGVPTLFRHFALGVTSGQEYPHLRLISVGGEAVLKTDVHLYQKHFAQHSLFRHGLGGTEAQSMRRYLINKDTQIEDNVVPVGYAVEDKEIALVGEDGEMVGPGEVGEIVVRSRYISPGYWRRPELTQARFKDDPDHPHVRLFFTGDLGRMRADGCLYHLGRKDFQVKIRGFRVELGEIEAVLMQHPAIRVAAVIVDDQEGLEKRLVAFVVPVQGIANPRAEDLRVYLAERLPDYMVPFAYVMLEEMPLTPTGKVDRQALSQLGQGWSLGEDLEAPGDDLELGLVNIWEEVLRVSPIGVRNNFFSLGGNSLLAARLIERVESRFGKTLPMTVFMETPTVKGLASMLRGGDGARAAVLVPLQPHGTRPPFYIVHGAGGHLLRFRHLVEAMGLDYPLYGLQARGLDGIETPFTNLEEMAAYYVQAIREQQPDGPYRLGGFSFGGYVAYEMARHLTSQGQEVAILAILDAKASQVPSFHSCLNRSQAMRYRISSFREKSIFLAQSKFHLPRLAKNLLRGDKSKSKLVPSQVGGRRGLAYLEDVMEPELIALMDENDMASPYIKLMEANFAALESYTFQPYPGKLILFKAVEAGKGVCYGWEVLAQGGVEVHAIPGTHLKMVEEPNVKVLARDLKACIDRSMVS